MSTNAVEVERVNTRGLAPADGQTLWTDLVTTYHCAFDCNYETAWQRGSSVRARTERFQYVSWRCDEAIYQRTPRHIANDHDDSALLLVARAGSLAVSQEAGSVLLRAGQAYPLTMARPFVLRHGRDAAPLVLSLDSMGVTQRLCDFGSPTEPTDLRTGLGGTVRVLLESLLQESDVLAGHEFDAVADRLVDLFALVQERDATDSAPGRLGEVAQAARLYIQQNLGDRNLSTQQIAEALGWSARQVQLALSHVGTTPGRLIKNERLNAAYARVLAPGADRASITELAQELGFATPSAFSTAFRARYGLSPRRLRAESTRSRSTPPVPPA